MGSPWWILTTPFCSYGRKENIRCGPLNIESRGVAHRFIPRSASLTDTTPSTI
jgi:hypothetical protein